jgi:FlaA1/EpsC-like NDP-sugar epimerase
MYSGKRILLVGYGVLGSELLVDLEQAGAVVVVILDDRHLEIPSERRVRGAVSDLPKVLEQFDIDLVVVGASLITSSMISWVNAQAHQLNLPIYLAPERSEVHSLENLHEVTREPGIEDLFARSSLEVDQEAIAAVLAGQRVMVTGAGGSIGRKIVLQLAEFGAEIVGLLDRDDCLLHDVAVEMSGQMFDERFPLFHVDVQHRGQVMKAFESFRPDVVLHSAALKHVTTLEMNPANALSVNVLGTANVLEASSAVGSGLFVNVSTDKAASRVGSLGLSKYIGERMTRGEGHPGYRSVRFGNVIGSRGSVLPSFRLQAQHHGVVHVRGDTTSRFFMTGGEAASLVLSTLAQEEPDGTYVFKMSEPVDIIRLAHAVIGEVGSNAGICIVPLGPGETRHEKLFADDENPSNTSVPEVCRVEPPPLDRSLVCDRLSRVDDLFDLEHSVARRLLEDLAVL